MSVVCETERQPSMNFEMLENATDFEHAMHLYKNSIEGSDFQLTMLKTALNLSTTYEETKAIVNEAEPNSTLHQMAKAKLRQMGQQILDNADNFSDVLKLLKTVVRENNLEKEMLEKLTDMVPQ